VAEPIIVVRNLSKAFPGVQALKDVQFDLYPGEVHTLVGENGAGKSTLMKILSGVYQRDTGEILINGKPAEIHNPRAAQKLGISIIHQELNLMNHLTAAQNIYIGREPRKPGGFVLDEKALNAQARKLFETLRMDFDPRVKVGELTIAKQQMVEIVKALSFNARVLIMDEPTAALNETEVEELFDIIRLFAFPGCWHHFTFLIGWMSCSASRTGLLCCETASTWAPSVLRRQISIRSFL